MQDFAVSLVIGIGFGLAAVAFVLGIYFAARRILSAGEDGHRTYDAASSVAFRIAALYGLILALVYAQELDDYKGIRTNLAEEAVAVADIYNDMARYGGPLVAEVQTGLARYLAVVVDGEWHRLGRRAGLEPEAWKQWDAVYVRLLDLTPSTDRERYLADRMRDRAAAIARFRQMRETTAGSAFSGMFWGPATMGLALLAIPFYVFPPTPSNLTLLSIFGLYSGVVLFFIYMFANPFEPPGKLPPTPFIRLLEGEIGTRLAPPPT